MNYDNSKLTNQLDSIYIKNQYQIENNVPYKQKPIFEKKLEKLYSDDFKVLLGGPIQTILTGFFGLTVLLVRRKKIKNCGLEIVDWIAVFLSLFWLREVFNLVHSIAFKIFFREGNYFGGDEKYISEYLNLNSGTLPIILGIIGSLTAAFVIFKILPRQIQLPFILSGFTGGTIGFLLWFKLLGPIFIP